MRLFTHLIVALCIAALSGCAATVSRPTGGDTAMAAPASPVKQLALQIKGSPTVEASADWQIFKAEWRTAFTEAAKGAALPAQWVEGDPASLPEGTVLVRVLVNDYRYLTPGARFGFGIMTGNAFIDASAEFIDMPAGRALGLRKYTTSSSAWQGVFSAMTDKQVAAISAEMVKEIKK